MTRALLAAALRVAARTVPAARDPRDPSELCCVAARLLCAELYGLPRVELAPVPDWHLWDTGRPWSPCEAAVASGCATGPLASHDGPPPAGVYLVQIWRGVPGSARGTGHTLVWWTDGGPWGWQLDSVEGRVYDARAREWSALRAEAAWGHRAVRLASPGAP